VKLRDCADPVALPSELNREAEGDVRFLIIGVQTQSLSEFQYRSIPVTFLPQRSAEAGVRVLVLWVQTQRLGVRWQQLSPSASGSYGNRTRARPGKAVAAATALQGTFGTVIFMAETQKSQGKALPPRLFTFAICALPFDFLFTPCVPVVGRL
jgi:hypothetical protein